MIFDNIDEKATIAKAKKVLANYRRLERIVGTPYSLSSSSNYQQTPHGKPYKASSRHEDHLMRTVSAEQERDQIRQAVERLDDLYKTILLMKYCQREKLKGIALYMEIGYEQTQFYRYLNLALLQFAECYKHGELLTCVE